MNSIPLISNVPGVNFSMNRGNTSPEVQMRQEINTSLVALKKEAGTLEGLISEALQILDEVNNRIATLENDTVKKNDVVNVVQSGNMNPVTSNAVANSNAMPVNSVTSGNMHSVTSNAVFNAIGQWEELYTDGSSISIKGMITNNGAYLKIWMQNYLLPSNGYPVFQLPAKYNNAMTHWVSRLYYFQNNNSAENPYDWCFANIEKNIGVIVMYGTANLYCYGDFILSL